MHSNWDTFLKAYNNASHKTKAFVDSDEIAKFVNGLVTQYAIKPEVRNDIVGLIADGVLGIIERDAIFRELSMDVTGVGPEKLSAFYGDIQTFLDEHTPEKLEASGVTYVSVADQLDTEGGSDTLKATPNTQVSKPAPALDTQTNEADDMATPVPPTPMPPHRQQPAPVAPMPPHSSIPHTPEIPDIPQQQAAPQFQSQQPTVPAQQQAAIPHEPQRHTPPMSSQPYQPSPTPPQSVPETHIQPPQQPTTFTRENIRRTPPSSASLVAGSAPAQENQPLAAYQEPQHAPLQQQTHQHPPQAPQVQAPQEKILGYRSFREQYPTEESHRDTRPERPQNAMGQNPNTTNTPLTNLPRYSDPDNT